MSEEKKRGWLRDEMPGVAAIVDEFKEVFGAESITAGIADLMRKGEFHCEDFTTGKKFGDPVAGGMRGAGVSSVRYVSPNGLPSMLDVKWSPSGAFCEFEGGRYTSDEFYRLCMERVRQFRKGGK